MSFKDKSNINYKYKCKTALDLAWGKKIKGVFEEGEDIDKN